MKFKVLHNMRGRMRIHVMTNEMTDLQADKLEYDLAAQDMILTAKVYERTSDVVITYAGEDSSFSLICKLIIIDGR